MKIARSRGVCLGQNEDNLRMRVRRGYSQPDPEIAKAFGSLVDKRSSGRRASTRKVARNSERSFYKNKTEKASLNLAGELERYSLLSQLIV